MPAALSALRMVSVAPAIGLAVVTKPAEANALSIVEEMSSRFIQGSNCCTAA
jgi:hypothetical protein